MVIIGPIQPHVPYSPGDRIFLVSRRDDPRPTVAERVEPVQPLILHERRLRPVCEDRLLLLSVIRCRNPCCLAIVNLRDEDRQLARVRSLLDFADRLILQWLLMLSPYG